MKHLKAKEWYWNIGTVVCFAIASIWTYHQGCLFGQWLRRLFD